MTPLNIILTLIISLISVFLCVQLLKFYRRLKRAWDNATVKNIYVTTDNSSVDEDEDDFPKVRIATESGAPRPEDSKEPGRRRYPRTKFQSFVDFINEGTLYKEQTRDLSYSGIFIQSRTPEKYKKNAFIIMTFQTDEAGPQRRKGWIVRIDHTGIGVNFVR